jgi:hypothetical protein
MSRRRAVAACIRIKSEGSCLPVHTECSCDSQHFYLVNRNGIWPFEFDHRGRLRESRRAIWPSKKLRPPGDSTSLCLSGCQNVAAVVRLQMPSTNLINFKLLLPFGSAIRDVSSWLRLIPAGDFVTHSNAHLAIRLCFLIKNTEIGMLSSIGLFLPLVL